MRQYFDSRVWKTLGNEKKKVNAGHVDLITIGRQMHHIFSSKPIMRQVTHVLIENQITPIANRMKTVQGMLSQELVPIVFGALSIMLKNKQKKETVFF